MEGRKLQSAYYYSFEPTGDKEIDNILDAIGCAGKSAHHTEAWQDDMAVDNWGHEGATPVEWIQNAANEAAKKRKEQMESIMAELRKLSVKLDQRGA